MDLSTIAQIFGFFFCGNSSEGRVDWHPSCCSSIVFTFQHPPKKIAAFLTGHTFKAVFFLQVADWSCWFADGSAI